MSRPLGWPALSLLILLVLLPATALNHPCERHAKSRVQKALQGAWTSGCSHTHSVLALHEARVWACVPHAPGQALQVPAQDDPAMYLYGADAFLGRAVRQEGGENLTYAIDFLAQPDPVFLHGFLCTQGLLRGLEPGTYSWWVTREFADYLWNIPWSVPVQGDNNAFGAINPATPPDFPSSEVLQGDARLVVEGAAVAEAELPFCTAAMEGRWVGYEEHEMVWQGAPFHVATAGQYVPSACRLRTVSWPQLDECLDVVGNVVFLGDSNVRRAFKQLYTRGTWCSGEGERELGYCLCEDCGLVCEERGIPTPFMPQAEAGLPFGTANASNLRFVNHPGAAAMSLEGLRSVLGSTEGLGALVVGGPGVWDTAAADITLFQSRLQQLARHLAEVVPPTTQLVFKTWPFFCCGNVALSGQAYMPRRFTEKRGAVMAAMYRRVMTDAFPEALWWDTLALSEAAPRAPRSWKENVARCHSAHLDSYLVEQDVGVLRHLLCEAAERRRAGAAR